MALSEVEPLTEEPDTGIVLRDAIAAHVGVEPENLVGYVLAVEQYQDGELRLSTVHTVAPFWRLEGYTRELLRRVTMQPEPKADEEATDEN